MLKRVCDVCGNIIKNGDYYGYLVMPNCFDNFEGKRCKTVGAPYERELCEECVKRLKLFLDKEK